MNTDNIRNRRQKGFAQVVLSVCPDTLGRVWRESFGRHYPAMTLVVVAGLLEERARVEIEATAVVP